MTRLRRAGSITPTFEDYEAELSELAYYDRLDAPSGSERACAVCGRPSEWDECHRCQDAGEAM